MLAGEGVGSCSSVQAEKIFNDIIHVTDIPGGPPAAAGGRLNRAEFYAAVVQVSCVQTIAPTTLTTYILYQ